MQQPPGARIRRRTIIVLHDAVKPKSLSSKNPNLGPVKSLRPLKILRGPSVTGVHLAKKKNQYNITIYMDLCTKL